MSKDPEKMSEFYARVFDWKITHRPQLDYRIVDTGAGAGINGGIVKPDKPDPWPGNMTFYVDVEDLAAYRRNVEDAGGRVVVEMQEVPGMGAFSLFLDPEGRMIGLWQHIRAVQPEEEDRPL
jgi:predicted enzyme related to lactoylglutathione lyase